MPFAATQMDLETLALSEVSQKDRNHDTTYAVMCLVTRSCPTICSPMDCSPPGSSVHGILQATALQWVAMPSSRGSSQPRDQTQVFHIADRFFIIWATREPQFHLHVESQTPYKCTYLWSRNRLTDIENRLVIAKREGRLGEGWIRRLALADANYHTHTHTHTHIHT